MYVKKFKCPLAPHVSYLYQFYKSAKPTTYCQLLRNFWISLFVLGLYLYYLHRKMSHSQTTAMMDAAMVCPMNCSLTSYMRSSTCNNYTYRKRFQWVSMWAYYKTIESVELSFMRKSVAHQYHQHFISKVNNSIWNCLTFWDPFKIVPSIQSYCLRLNMLFGSFSYINQAQNTLWH